MVLGSSSSATGHPLPWCSTLSTGPIPMTFSEASVIDSITKFVMETNDFIRSINRVKLSRTRASSQVFLGAIFQKIFSDGNGEDESHNIIDEAEKGVKNICKRIGCSRYQMELLLRLCGAPPDPFISEWNEPISVVWQRMHFIRKNF